MLVALPDNVVIDLPIEYMEVKDSMFVPTIQLAVTRRVLRKAADALGYKVVFASVIHEGYLGVRFWRVDD